LKLELLGIPNCNTVKKARTFLDDREVAFEFRDLRKQPLDEAQWRDLVAQDQDGVLVNTRGPSFRKTGVDKSQLDDPEVVTQMLLQTPTAMKRPAVLIDGKLWGVGFSEARFDQLVAQLG
jgi:Spx/MgsR family transcriptional regulator